MPAPNAGGSDLKTFTVVHNIPSPYRLHLFDVLNARLQCRGIRFQVYFMARSHTDRPHWVPKPDELQFEHTFWRDLGPSVGGVKWHLNPGLVQALRHAAPDYLMVGGLWDSLTTPLVSFSAPRRVGIGWFEGNTHAVGRVTGLIGAAKKSLCAQYQFLAVPGSEGEKYANIFLDRRERPEVLLLPNIVDEQRFLPRWKQLEETENSVRKELGLKPGELVAIWPARLVPVKGVLEFLAILDRDILRGWKVIILGQGPLEAQVHHVLRCKGLDSQVQVRRYLPYERMQDVYAACDLFLLPSLYDPNPLSVVEAMHSGLPILVSTLIGNYPEACHEGRNGWSFDPHDKRAALEAAERAFSTPRSELREMGRESELIANEFWGSLNAVERFLASVLRA